MTMASVAALAAAFALVFAYAPTDADQGLVQKIFYLHVPLAIVALCGFMAAAANWYSTNSSPGMCRIVTLPSFSALN